MSSDQPADATPPSVPQTTPRDIGFGHPEYHFVQAIMQMQQTLGEIRSSVDSLRQSVDSTKSKVDDLVAWKNKILGGAVVLGAICTLMGFMVTKFSNYITIGAPTQSQAAVQLPAEQKKLGP